MQMEFRDMNFGENHNLKEARSIEVEISPKDAWVLLFYYI
jgi:hypothetical protein